jgi:hypothetical protein
MHTAHVAFGDQAEGLVKASQRFLRDTHVLPQLFYKKKDFFVLLNRPSRRPALVIRPAKC